MSSLLHPGPRSAPRERAELSPDAARSFEVCVIGAGYVGLVTAAGLAELGHRVRCVDIDAERITVLQDGGLPIYEPGLDGLIAHNREAERLSFTTDMERAIASADVVFCGVSTPPREDGAADLGAVLAVAERVRNHAVGHTLLVLKSTVPVGTHERISRIVADAPGEVQVVSNPEFLKEGSAVDDFFRPDRIVVGVREEHVAARQFMAALYAPLQRQGTPILWMDPASAELTKYVANTMLAMRIAFMNEVAALCEQVGADVHHVREGVGSDARIGPAFLFASCGYGGSCFPKDVQALVHSGLEHEVRLTLADATHRANERQKGVLFEKLTRHLGGDFDGKRIAVWGAAFKPGTDDIRNSPALTLIDGLLAAGAEVVVHDPEAAGAVSRRYGSQIRVSACPYEACREADALVLVTDWSHYHEPDFGRIAGSLRQRLILDGRNIWSRAGLKARGFHYEGIGVRA